MAVTVTAGLTDSLATCVDEITEGIAQAVAITWRANARRYAPVDTGEYKDSFTTARVTGSAGAYRVAMDNTARHASFVEFGSGGWVSTPGKRYRFTGTAPTPATADIVFGDNRWGHPGTPEQGVMREALVDAIRAAT